jgi:hypothetical protein
MRIFSILKDRAAGIKYFLCNPQFFIHRAAGKAAKDRFGATLVNLQGD